MNIAVILAGGVGSRVGADIPKQFIKVLGKPIIAYTIEAFQNHMEIDCIEVVCHKDYIEYLKTFLKKYNFTKLKWICEGGEDFQHSVMNGLNYLRNKASDDDIVLIHYAASPFVTAEIISDGIRVCKLKGNSASATPCYLLLGSNDDGTKSTRWVDRDRIMQLNSPQCFNFKYVCELYQEGERQGILSRIEPHTTTLMYELGETIYFSKGNQTNIKITTKEDLDLFAAYISQKKEV